MRRAVLITGASTGIGAIYADRFARRGHDLVLVARNVDCMTTLAKRLRSETRVNVDVVPADLTEEQDLALVEQRLREDVRIGVLINNAGTAIPRHFIEQGGADISRLIALNVTALTRLANAAAPRFAQAGEGAIVNLASVLGLAPEMGATVYGATKAFTCRNPNRNLGARRNRPTAPRCLAVQCLRHESPGDAAELCAGPRG
jgi:short-subunit dehydrogenase